MQQGDVSCIGIRGCKRRSAIRLPDFTSYRVFYSGNCSMDKPCADAREYVYSKSFFGKDSSKLQRKCCHRTINGSPAVIISAVSGPVIIIKAVLIDKLTTGPGSL